MTAATVPTSDRDFTNFRGDLTSVYNPANAAEQMFVEQIARNLLRLKRAQEAEQRYFDTTDILEAITKKPKEYKAITKYVSDCERAWRNAVVHLERMQRQRMRPSKPGASSKSVHQQPTKNPETAVAAPATNVAGNRSTASRAG